MVLKTRNELTSQTQKSDNLIRNLPPAEIIGSEIYLIIVFGDLLYDPKLPNSSGGGVLGRRDPVSPTLCGYIKRKEAGWALPIPTKTCP